jgi:flagellar biosynthetic protein FliQ
MTEQAVIDIAVRAIWVAIKLASPALLATLVAGVVISIFQAATQINEQTLAFIPKILVMVLAVVITGPWLIKTMMEFTVEIFSNLPAMTH